ncbi:MAG: GFA family protein [Pseudomonadota bacterium]|nr:GFA family protein [Pseudomonadota bacterium]
MCLSRCLSCRRYTGAPVVTLAGYRREQVAWTADPRKIYRSSPDVERGFCGNCGTPLTWEGDGGEHGPLIEILISTTDDPAALVPQFHIHNDERIEWFDIADGLPHFHVWGDDGSEPYRHGPAI